MRAAYGGPKLSVATCEAQGGVPTADPGDGSLLGNGCHDAAEILGAIHEQGWREGGLCCAAGGAAPSQGYTVAECTAAGGRPHDRPRRRMPDRERLPDQSGLPGR